MATASPPRPPRGFYGHLQAIATAAAKLLWLSLDYLFVFRSLGRAAVDRAFHLLGIAFLEPRRGLLYAMRKLQRLMVGLLTPLTCCAFRGDV